MKIVSVKAMEYVNIGKLFSTFNIPFATLNTKITHFLIISCF